MVAVVAVGAVADIRAQSDLKFQAKAIEALQHATEDYAVHLFEDVSLCLPLMPQRCRLCFAGAGEFGGDSRQAMHYISQGYTGLATLLRGNALPLFRGTRKLISFCCSLLGVSAGSVHEAWQQVPTTAFLLNCGHLINSLSRETSAPRESAL